MTTGTGTDPAPDTTGTGPSSPTDGPDSPAGVGDLQGQDRMAQDEPRSFSREYVQRLRDEAASHRIKAKRADTLASRLVASLAAQTNRLADPTDLVFTPDLLDDDGMPNETKVADAIEDLVRRKPHLASRRPAESDVGQGAQSEPDAVSLADLLRQGA